MSKTPIEKRQRRNVTTITSRPQRGPGRIRGLTRAQYLVLRRMVQNGETTWEELERKHVVLPSGHESDYRRNVRTQLAGK